MQRLEDLLEPVNNDALPDRILQQLHTHIGEIDSLIAERVQLFIIFLAASWVFSSDSDTNILTSKGFWSGTNTPFWMHPTRMRPVEGKKPTSFFNTTDGVKLNSMLHHVTGLLSIPRCYYASNPLH